MRECASEAGERMVLPKMGAGMLAGSGGDGGSGPAPCVGVERWSVDEGGVRW